MHLFTDNQVTHLYVASGLQNTENSMVTGNVAFRKIGDSMYMLFKSKKGDIQRSDIIDIKNIMWAKATSARAMARKAKRVTIIIGSGASDTLVAGQTYIVNLRFDHYQGMSDEDITYRVGSYLAPNNTVTAADAATAIAKELKANLGIDVNSTVNSLDKDLVTITPNGNVITITEKFQPWHRGTMQVVPVYFSASLVPIVQNGIETKDWATILEDADTPGTFDTSLPYSIGDLVTYNGEVYQFKAAHAAGAWSSSDVTKVRATNTSTLNNSYDIADMEYFYMGERGDQYRLNGFPNYIPTDYLITPSDNSDGYDVLQVHYYYLGSNEQAQKSEKDLIIVAPATQANTDTTKFGDIMEAIIGSTGSSGATFAYVSQFTTEKKLA